MATKKKKKVEPEAKVTEITAEAVEVSPDPAGADPPEVAPLMTADEDGYTFIDDARLVMDAMGAIVEIVKESEPDAEHVIVAHAFFGAAEKAAKEGKDALRPHAIKHADDLGESGKLKTVQGSITHSWTSRDGTVEATDATIELLEAKGVLEQTVQIHATLKDGVEAEHITEDEMATIQKYFDIELVPDLERIYAKVTLGELDNAELEATLDRTPGKSFDTLRITPNKDLKKAIGA